ncbi:hypothetical protein MAR_033699, partial [Mya arenaria]
EGCQAPIDKGNDAFYRNGDTYTVTHESCSGGNIPSLKGQITCVNGHWSEQVSCLKGASYSITVKTADDWFAGTNGEVYLYMYGSIENSGKIILHGEFEAGDVDLTNGHFVDVGKIKRIVLSSGRYVYWLPDYVTIHVEDTDDLYVFRYSIRNYILDGSTVLYPEGNCSRPFINRPLAKELYSNSDLRHK